MNHRCRLNDDIVIHLYYTNVNAKLILLWWRGVGGGQWESYCWEPEQMGFISSETDTVSACIYIKFEYPKQAGPSSPSCPNTGKQVSA